MDTADSEENISEESEIVLDILGNPVLAGDTVVFPLMTERRIRGKYYYYAKLLVAVCDGYDQKGINLKYVNPFTLRWVRFNPKRHPIIKVQMPPEEFKNVAFKLNKLFSLKHRISQQAWKMEKRIHNNKKENK